jgi:putative flippase GtrA
MAQSDTPACSDGWRTVPDVLCEGGMVPPHDSPRAGLAAIWPSRAVSRKAFIFALIGVLNTAIDYGVFMLARLTLARSTGAVDAFGAVGTLCHCGNATTVLLVAANVISWSVAISCSYVMNSSITFAAESGRKLRWRHYATFVVAGLVGLVANTATLVFAAQVLSLPVWLAKGLSILASFVANFSMSHFVVFRVRGGAS